MGTLSTSLLASIDYFVGFQRVILYTIEWAIEDTPSQCQERFYKPLRDESPYHSKPVMPIESVLIVLLKIR